MFDSLGTRHYLDVGIISEKETGSKNHSGVFFFEDFESFHKVNIGGHHIRV